MLTLLFMLMTMWFTYQFFKQVGESFKAWWKEESRVVYIQSNSNNIDQRINCLLDKIEASVDNADKEYQDWYNRTYSPNQVALNTMKHLGLEIK